jgi:hypothetical protein
VTAPPLVVEVLGADPASVSVRLDVGEPGRGGRRDVILTAANRAEAPVEAGLRVELLLGPTDDPGWLIPGLFYGENRPEGCLRRYPRYVAGRVDVEAMEADAWSFRADRCATPAVFAWDGERGAALVTGERSAVGESGVGLALLDGRPALRLHFPFREEPLRYDGSNAPWPPEVSVHRFEPGEEVRIELALYELPADRHGYAGVLRDVHARAGRMGDVAWVGIEEAAEIAAWGLARWHYRPDPARLVETVAFDRDSFGASGDRDAMHVSWVSGVPYAAALLRHGRRRQRPEQVEVAAAVLDHVAAARTPGQTFWAQWTADAGWTTGWHPDPRRLHCRTLGDATLFLLRAAAAESRLGHRRPLWDDAVRSNLDAILRVQRADGALPAAIDVDGQALDWHGSAGLAWVAPLAEAAPFLDEPRYLDAAARAGAWFGRFVEREFIHGAPEDVDLAPTSEDGVVALTAYAALHRQQPAGAWLDTARRAAEWMLTFRYTYDVAFPPLSLLGRYGFRTRGSDQASPANQHLHAFGLLCLPELVQLARELDDAYLLESARENLSCLRQLVARTDGDVNAYRGMTAERYFQTDCFQPKGMLGTLSHAWSVGVLLWACECALELGDLAS